mgnify:CR=1 FL=1
MLFRSHNDPLGDGPVVTFETERLHIDDVLFDFTDFLRGAGFVFDGDVQIVNDFAIDEKNTGCGGGCSDCQCDEVNFDRQAEESRVRWSHTVNSMMNPPKFRANGHCEVCGLPESVMKGHKCFDDNCPIHAPQRGV